MKPVKNPCNCQPPQRHAHCHCLGQCAKGDAYQKYVEYRSEVNKQNYMQQLRPDRNIKVSPSKRTGNL